MRMYSKVDNMTPQHGVVIVYEDNHVIVAVKPQNLLSQKDATNDPDILGILKNYLKQKYNKPGEVYLGLVHRLDRPAGGLMVFARTSKAASRLFVSMQNGEIEKKYMICCSGVPDLKESKFTDYLLKLDGNIVKIIDKETPGAQRAQLIYKLIETNGKRSICEVTLISGRKHQIRVQFASRGMPLIGDVKYGRSGKKLALWASSLAFIHPVKKERMEFTYPPPKGVVEL